METLTSYAHCRTVGDVKFDQLINSSLMEKITPENVPDIMKISKKFGQKELCDKALEVFKKSF